MKSVEFGSLTLYTMHKLIKNIFDTIVGTYNFVISIIYEKRQKKTGIEQFDSRTIPPPRQRNTSERNLFGAISNEIRNIPCIFSYIDKTVHSSIYWFKYKRDQYAINVLSQALSDEIIWMTSDKLDARHNIKEWIITSAPSTSFNNGNKKWDHNNDIANELKKILNLGFVFKEIFTLGKIQAKSSKKLNRNERINLTANKFALLSDAEISGKSGLIIFDDVTTTGSTLKNLADLAAKMKPKIILVVAIAH